MVVCKPLHWQDRARWDEFVAAHPHGTPFHLTAWRDTVHATFGFQPKYRMAVDDAGRIVGVLPLFLIDNFLTGRVLISTPFAVYGGILATSEAAHEILTDQARTMAARIGVQYLELRNACPDQRAGFRGIGRYATFKKAVAPGTPETLLAEIPQKTRNLVRKALKHDYRTQPARDLESFYKLIVRSYRRHGTPVFPLRFFKAIVVNFGRLVDVREIVLEGKVVAASMNFLFKDEMHTYYAASAREALAAAPNNYMYFDHLLWAANHGFKRFDFGRSKVDTGPYQFKKHFGAEIQPLPYEVMLVRRQDIPDFTPKNPTFAMASRVWQKIPLPMTRVLGPALISLFP